MSEQHPRVPAGLRCLAAPGGEWGAEGRGGGAGGAGRLGARGSGAAAFVPLCGQDGGGRPSLAALRVGGCGVGGSAALRLGSQPCGAARGAGGGAGLRRAGLLAVPVALLGVRQRGGAGAALPLSCNGL